MVYEGSSVLEALRRQPALPEAADGERKHLNLPIAPAIEIMRFTSLDRKSKTNRRIHVTPWFYIKENGEPGDWLASAVQPALYKMYELRGAILHKAKNSKYGLIVRAAVGHRKRWVLLTPGEQRMVLTHREQERYTDGDGSDEYNAVLALYGSCAVEVVDED
jgi:hypothetical protein